jgi:ATP-dependent RNA helicase RhlE
MLTAKPLPRPHIRALILTPTRELAAQVEQSVKTYGRHLQIKSTTVFGGVNINPQIQTLRRGVDVLVATPGRLLDHVRSRTVDLSKVEILVLDEADRMLDMGFIHDIRRILDVLPKKRQNLFFSATFPREIRQFADSFLTSPAEIAIARESTTADLIKQVVHPVDKGSKRALLSSLIGKGNWQQVLIFTRTKHGANRLAGQLEKDGISAAAIHGNKSQGARTRALADFKRGTVRALVATDIAARGLDIKELPHVVNYELPNVPEDYVHRIGRTGRAGSNGVAMSLVCKEEKPLLADIERTTRNRIESVIVPGFEPGSHHAADEEDSRDVRRGRQNPAHRNAGRSGEQKPSGGRASRGTQAGRRSSQNPQGKAAAGSGRDAQGKPSGQPGSSSKRRRSSGKGKRPGADGQVRAQEPSSTQSRPFHNALRAVASIFGGASQRDN